MGCGKKPKVDLSKNFKAVLSLIHLDFNLSIWETAVRKKSVSIMRKHARRRIIF